MIDVVFFKHLGLLATIIAGLTVFKVISCKPFKDCGEDFDWKKLYIGLLGNLLVAAAISVVYAAGCCWGSDLIVLTINTTELTVQAAIDLMLLTAIGVYGTKLVINFAEMLGIKSKIGPIKEVIPEVADKNISTDEEVNEEAKG